MTDRVSVMNLALVKMGASDTIVSPDEESTAVLAIKAAWDATRKACIRGGERAPQWNFARRYAETAARAFSAKNPIPYGWSGAYPKPDGAIRLAEILYPLEAVAADRWTFANGEVLLRDSGPLRAWWLFDVEEPALWDDSFVQTFAARLAYETCDRITGDLNRKRALWAEYESNLNAATKVDAIENPNVEPEESDWITARYRYSSGGWGR